MTPFSFSPGASNEASSGNRRRILIVIGTRPEAIKMAPVARALGDLPDTETMLCITGQQREVLHQALDLFQWKPDFDLDLMQPNQELTDLTARVMQGVARVLEQVRPDVVLVQGDTATTFGAAMAAFHARIPVGHVEAGLRSGDVHNPFPEEAYRRMITEIATWHFAPTDRAYRYLLGTGIAADRVVLTGNTVVDSLYQVLSGASNAEPPTIPGIDWGQDTVLIATAHRRENWENLPDICAGLRSAASLSPSIRVLFLLHPNPILRRTVERELCGVPQAILLEPAGYPAFLQCLSRARMVLTDSGGIQEEGVSLGKPIVILRETTERPEVLSCGLGVLAGTNPARIAAAVSDFLLEPPAPHCASVFGDGRASQRIAATLHMAMRGTAVAELMESPA